MKNLIAVLLMSAPALALAQYSNPHKSFYEHAADNGVKTADSGEKK